MYENTQTNPIFGFPEALQLFKFSRRYPFHLVSRTAWCQSLNRTRLLTREIQMFTNKSSRQLHEVLISVYSKASESESASIYSSRIVVVEYNDFLPMKQTHP